MDNIQNAYIDDFGPTPQPHLENPCFQAALKLAADYGFRVMPVNGKIPVMEKWPVEASSDPAKITDQFARHPGATNVGVVTGGDIFALDLDTKNNGWGSLTALEDKYGKLPVTLTAITGTGGGHVYFRKAKKYKGYSIVTAVCVLGEGIDIRGDRNGFCVAPPSVHPVTGKTYEFTDPKAAIAEAPEWLMQLLIAAERKVRSELSQFKGGNLGFKEKLSNAETTVMMIRLSAMVKRKFGFDGEELVREMHRWAQAKAADPAHYTEEYVRRKCQWAIKNVEIETDEPQEQQDVEPFEEAKQEDGPDADYHARLDTTSKGLPRKTIQNAVTILSSSPFFWRGFAYDEFNRKASIARDLTDKLKRGGMLDDEAITEVRYILNCMVGEDFGRNLTDEAMTLVAYQNSFNPVKDYLNRLTWDGVPRLDSWLTRYLGAEASPLNKAIGSAWTLSAVARIMQPGCEVDGALILESDKQGIGKNAAMKALMPDPKWHCELAGDLSRVDTKIQLSGCWIVEMSEMKNLKRSEVEEIKAFLTATSDRYRIPWGRKDGVHQRQNVFVGSSNNRQYLKDVTGNRRFWPVRCNPVVAGKWIDRDSLARDRDQLWAEAYHRYSAGESWKIQDDALIEQLQGAQEERMIADPWEPVIAAYLGDSTETTINEILAALEKPTSQQNTGDTMRVAGILRRLGWDDARKYVNGIQIRIWWRVK